MFTKIANFLRGVKNAIVDFVKDWWTNLSSAWKCASWGEIAISLISGIGLSALYMWIVALGAASWWALGSVFISIALLTAAYCQHFNFWIGEYTPASLEERPILRLLFKFVVILGVTTSAILLIHYAFEVFAFLALLQMPTLIAKTEEAYNTGKDYVSSKLTPLTVGKLQGQVDKILENIDNMPAPAGKPVV